MRCRSWTTRPAASRASGDSGANGLGSAFSGPLRTSSFSTPSFSISPETLGAWRTTPMEPVTVLSRAKMRSAASAAI